MTLKEMHGLDVSRPLTDTERDAWRREFALSILQNCGQLFDPAAGVCLANGEVARYRQRRAIEILFHAIELAALHGITEETLLREVGR